MEQISTRVAEYNATEAALAELRKTFAGAKYDVTTKDGMVAARKARFQLRTLRTTLEDKRKEIKAPVLLQARLIDSEAQRLTKEIVALEDPIDAQITAFERAEEEKRQAAIRADQERVAGIEQRIAAMDKLPSQMVGKTAAQIAAALDTLRADNPEDWAQGLLPKATFTHRDTIAALENMHASRAAAEAEALRQAEERARLDAEKAELDRRQAEQRAADEKARLEREEADRQARAKIEADERAARARIEEAERKAREAREAEEAKAKAARDAEEARLKAERDRLDAQRRAAEEQEHQAKIAKEREAEALARAERERQAAEEERRRQEQEAAAAREREAQDAREAEERERRRREAEELEAREMLVLFVERFSHIEKLGPVVNAVKLLLPMVDAILRKKAA